MARCVDREARCPVTAQRLESSINRILAAASRYATYHSLAEACRRVHHGVQSRTRPFIRASWPRDVVETRRQNA
jgi:hypothetical protein